MGRHRRGVRLRSVVTGVALVGALIVGCTEEPDAQVGDEVAAEDPESPDLAAKPELMSVLPDDRGEPPTTLETEDLVTGEGESAQRGAHLTVHFVGASWSSGQEFDATWDRDQPYSFTLGAGEVIPAWDEGLVGMREGGRRALVVPPEFAYGDRGSAAGIAPGETIVFIVDLLEVDAEQP